MLRRRIPGEERRRSRRETCARLARQRQRCCLQGRAGGGSLRPSKMRRRRAVAGARHGARRSCSDRVLRCRNKRAICVAALLRCRRHPHRLSLLRPSLIIASARNCQILQAYSFAGAMDLASRYTHLESLLSMHPTDRASKLSKNRSHRYTRAVKSYRRTFKDALCESMVIKNRRWC